MKKFYTCCFSGNRPNKLPWKNKRISIRYIICKRKLKNAIKKAINAGYTNFISGMALGIDTICAEIIIKLKKRFKIKLECAIPCLNQNKYWSKTDIDKYNYILSKADIITYTSKKNYYKGCMYKRNKYMIDNSSLLIAVSNNKVGGTKKTIDYAKVQKRKIFIIKP